MAKSFRAVDIIAKKRGNPLEQKVKSLPGKKSSF